MAEPERITVSLDTLRNELAQQELRLVDRLSEALERKADKAVVEEHDKRITVLEMSRASREHMDKELTDVERRVGNVERFIGDEQGAQKYKRWLVPAVATIIGSSWWVPILFTHHP